MEKILMTPERKKVKINTRSDKCLYDAPHNPPNSGQKYLTGINLYTHESRAGNQFFYTHIWSMWQGSEGSLSLISENDAKEFILERAELTDTDWGSIDINDSDILEIWPDIFEETA